MTMSESEGDPESKLRRLSDLVNRHVGGEVEPALHRDGKGRLAQAIAEARLRRGRPRRVWGVAMGLTLALGIGAGAAYFSLRTGASLAYVVTGGSVSEGGYVHGSGAAATLRFSEGSEVAFTQGARGRLAFVDEHGARIALESGRATLRIVERPSAHWSVDAGPFLIRVTGTEFDVDWSGIDGTLEIDLRKGSLRVVGPPAPSGITLRAGQRLIAQEGHLRVEALGTPSPRADEILRDLERGASEDAAESWSAQVAAGEHIAVLESAEARGLTSCYTECPLADLVALADAARSARRFDIARDALNAQRARFASSGAARTAAFLLGRVAEDSGDTAAVAQGFYDRYLSEAPSGPLAAEALGRKMLGLERTGQLDEARSLADQYLRKHAAGPYAPRARALLDSRSP